MLADKEIRKSMLGELDEAIKALQLLSERVYFCYRSGGYEDVTTTQEQIFVYAKKIEAALSYMLSCIENRR